MLSISFTVSLDGGTHNVCFPCINIPPTEYIYAAQDPPDVSNIHLFQYDRMEQRQNIIIRYMQGVFSKKLQNPLKSTTLMYMFSFHLPFSSRIYVCTWDPWDVSSICLVQYYLHRIKAALYLTPLWDTHTYPIPIQSHLYITTVLHPSEMKRKLCTLSKAFSIFTYFFTQKNTWKGV